MKKFRFSFLSIKYKILIVFTLFLGISVFFNVILSSYITFNRSREEAKRGLTYQIELFQNELNTIKESISNRADNLVINRNILDDMGYFYEARYNRYGKDEVGYKKSYFLYRLETMLNEDAFEGISVYTEDKLGLYITNQNAGLVITHDNREVLLSSNKRTGGRIISMFWKLWKEARLPGMFNESIKIHSDPESSFFFDRENNALMIQAIVPVMGYVYTDRKTSQVKVKNPTAATTRRLLYQPDEGVPTVIGHIVLTRIINEEYLYDLKKRTGMEPFLLSLDGRVELQILFKNEDRVEIPQTLFSSFKDVNRYIKIDSGYYYQFLTLMKSTPDQKPLMITGFAISEDDTIRNMIQTIIGLIFMSLIMLFVAWLLGFYFIDLFVTPIKSLVNATQEISNGNYKVKIGIKANDEIGNLVHTFNLMTKQINSAFDTLEAQNQELIRLSSMKSEFMANMSHELRTPLNSINANTETLLYGLNKKTDEITYELTNLMTQFDQVKKNNPAISEELDKIVAELETVTGYINEEEDIRLYILNKSEDKLKNLTDVRCDAEKGFSKLRTLLDEEDVKTLELYNAIKMSGKHLLGLIDMILNVSEFDKVKLSLDRAEVNIRDFVKEAINNANEIADFLFKSPYITISYTVDRDVPDKIFLDETWTKQVLDSYLFNAIKFTEQGEVKLVVVVEKTMLRFSVFDSGIGIGEESKDKIFTESGMPFADLENGDSNEEGAVSLALSKRLIMMQGGDIGFESERGKGSVFWFTLPKN